MTLGAVILAAGFGTRLGALTVDTPKPLLEVGGRPVASHLVDRLRELADLSSIVVVVNGAHDAQWAGWQTTIDDRDLIHLVSNGVRTNADRPGAVADLVTALGTLRKRQPDLSTAIVVAGDNLIGSSLTPLMTLHEQHGDPVLACRDLGDEVPPGRHGEVTVDAGMRIVEFREKPPDPRSPLAATCTYVFDRAACDAARDHLRLGDADSPGQFIASLAQSRPVRVHVLDGSYHDIGSPETLEAARREHLD